MPDFLLSLLAGGDMKGPLPWLAISSYQLYMLDTDRQDNSYQLSGRTFFLLSLE